MDRDLTDEEIKERREWFEKFRRRFKVFQITPRDVLSLLNWRRGELIGLPVLAELPDGYVVLDIGCDYWSRMFSVIIAHESFDEVPEGDRGPEVVPPLEARYECFFPGDSIEIAKLTAELQAAQERIRELEQPTAYYLDAEQCEALKAEIEKHDGPIHGDVVSVPNAAVQLLDISERMFQASIGRAVPGSNQ